MKILQINTVSGYGSTGRNAIELAEFVESTGNQVYISYGQGTSNYHRKYKIGGKLENHFHNIKSRLFGKQGYYSKKGTLNFIKYIKRVKPDLIHLNNLHGNYLNLKILFDFLSKYHKPVVWTLHDCWAYTGKCSHYTEIGCYKWQTHCDNCPQIKKYPPSLFLDQSFKMFDDKKKWFTSVNNMTIVPVSKWLEEEVKKSFLSKYKIKTIYNWVDHGIFKPMPFDKNILSKYNIPANKKIILGVSAGWKGNKLKDFLKLSEFIKSNSQIVLVGEKKKIKNLPHNITHIPYIHSTNDLARVYSLANVYVHVSIEDTFGKVIAEAMSCGTPVVAYNSTAIPEVIGNDCGFVVEPGDIKALFDKVETIFNNEKNKYSEPCRKRVKDNFDKDKVIDKYINLYKEILSV